MQKSKPLFELGRCVIVPNVLIILTEQDVSHLIDRHVSGDFGDISEGDKKLNQLAIRENNDRILSAYNIYEKRVYVITEWDRSVTSVFFSEDY